MVAPAHAAEPPELTCVVVCQVAHLVNAIRPRATALLLALWYAVPPACGCRLILVGQAGGPDFDAEFGDELPSAGRGVAGCYLLSTCCRLLLKPIACEPSELRANKAML